MANNADPSVIERSKRELGQMEAILGNENTINSLVNDILDHYENNRENLLTGKAMILMQTGIVLIRRRWRRSTRSLRMNSTNETRNSSQQICLQAGIHNAPCPIEISQQMPENINAVYRSEDKKIYVKAGQEAADIFRGISQELAHAHLDNGDYKRSDHAFTAYCVSYMLCSRYNVAKDMFLFERLPENLATMDARSVRNELSKIRDIANEISSDMAKVLEKDIKPKERSHCSL